MEILTAHAGSYPRVGDTAEEQRLRRAYAERERGEISPEEFERIQDEVTHAAMTEQIAAGLDLVTDGQIRWYDPISHLAGKLEHVTINGLLRFFDTNFYFRQPVVTGRVSRAEGLILEEYRFAKGVVERSVKPVLTGPYTLATSSIRQAGIYATIGSLMEDYARVLGEEVAALAQSGAELIQIDEPSLLRQPKDLSLVRHGLEILGGRRGGARLQLSTYFGDVTPLYEALQDLPVDVLGLDFTYSPRLPDLIARVGSRKVLALGLIDGRNTKMETETMVFPILDKILPRLDDGVIYLSPSCGLEYLSRDKAREKLRLLSRLRDGFLRRGRR